MRFSKSFKIFLIVSLCCIIYLPSLKNGFIWDDDTYIYRNPLLQNVDGLKDIWFTRRTHQYYPVVFTTFWVEHKIWGFNPAGYHAVNLILHILNALLLYRIVQKLYSRLAFPAALLFATHPIQVETVAWTMERKNLLCLFFILLTIISFLRFYKTGKTGHYIRALVLYMCALLSKSIAVCFIAVPFLYKWWKGKKITRQDLLTATPFFVFGLTSAANTAYLEMHRVGASGASWSLTFSERLLLSGQTLLFYVFKIWMPFTEFMFFYPKWQIDTTVWWQWLFLLFSLLILFALFAFRKQIGRGALALFGFYVISIFPALGFFNVYPMKFSYVADHFTYISTPSLILLFCASAFFLYDRLKTRLGSSRISIIFIQIIFTVFILYLSGKSLGLTKNYKSKITLWEKLIQKNPGISIAYNNLGYLYNERGEYKTAASYIKKGLKIDPNDASLYNNLGISYMGTENYGLAIGQLNKAIEIDNSCKQCYNNLGKTYYKLNNFTGAIDSFKKATDIDPDYAVSHNNLAQLHYLENDLELAAKHCRRAIELGYKVKPGFLEKLGIHQSDR